MKYFILNNGCSFSADKHPGTWSYVNFLPEKCWNIAKPGSGIETRRIKRFFKKISITEKEVELTHFIYQIPCPARQMLFLELSEKKFLSTEWTHPFTYEESVLRQLKTRRKCKSGRIQTIMSRGPHMHIVFDRQDMYLKKALCEVHKHVNIVRERYPAVKVIFLRYELTDIPLLYEFSHKFYKDVLTDYCKENDITYIYEKNFHTKWFRQNKLTMDGAHPNESGARFIAEKVKEYL